MKIPRWLPFLFALPTAALAAVTVWAVGVEAQRAEAVLLAELLARARKEVGHWQNNEALLKPPRIRVPEAMFLPRWYPPLVIPEAEQQAQWSRHYSQFDAAKCAIAEGRDNDASQLLQVLRGETWNGKVMTASGLPLHGLVLRASLDVDAAIYTKQYKDGIARELIEHAFAVQSPISERLIEDAVKFIEDDARWREKGKIFGLFRGSWMGHRSIPTCREFDGTVVKYASPRRGSRAYAGAGDWSGAFPWTEHDGATWFADFSETMGLVGIVSFDDIEAPLLSRQDAAEPPPGTVVRYRWRGQVIRDGLVSPLKPLAMASSGPLEVFVFPVGGDSETWRQPVRERAEKMTWRLGGVTLVVALASWLAWWVYRKQARLAELESNFIASVSHELRTPVAAISVLAERLESGNVKSPEEIGQYHTFIAQEGRRLAALIDNVLDFSRIEQKRKCYEFDAIDYRRLVGETVTLLRPYAEEKGLRLEEKLELPEDAETPEADAIAIRQVLVNLLDNAFKFTPPGGSVTVELQAHGDGGVLLTVSDTGPGIPEGESRRIFDRFYRSDNGLTRETTGAGIGLSIVKHIVDAHGGAIEVTNSEQGGAVIEVILDKKGDHEK